MRKQNKAVSAIAILAVIAILIAAAFTTTSESVQQTAWALLPPLIAIVLALVTKEVYSSLFIGILSGALLYSGFNFEMTLNHIFSHTVTVDGEEVTYGIISVLSDSYNVGILIFLVILGIMVQLMNRTGGSAAFGSWASEKIKTREGAQLSTIALGVLIFIDDYFNCLTVGSVMRPVTDKFKVSRAKLAYLIDATAAPVCIIAPISSWAAAVAGFVEGENGLALFIRTIPYNYYALLTIAMMVMLVLMHINYGPMAEHEYNAEFNGDIYTTPDRPYADAKDEAQGNGPGQCRHCSGHADPHLLPDHLLCHRHDLHRRLLQRGDLYRCLRQQRRLRRPGARLLQRPDHHHGLLHVPQHPVLRGNDGLPAGRLQADGSRHPDPDPGLDPERHDRQPGRQGIRGGRH